MSDNGIGPAAGVAGPFVELARRYIPAGYVESLIRTWVPVGVGSAIAWAAVHWHIVVGGGASAAAGTFAGALCIAGYYALGRLVERRWPKVGALLISFGLVQSKPVYAQPTEAVRLVDTQAGGAKRIDLYAPRHSRV